MPVHFLLSREIGVFSPRFCRFFSFLFPAFLLCIVIVVDFWSLRGVFMCLSALCEVYKYASCIKITTL